MSVACSQLGKLRGPCWISDRHTSYQSISGEKRGCEADQQRSEVQTLRSEEIFIRIQKKLKCCISYHHDIRRCGYQYNTEQNECFCFYRWEFTDFIFPFRFTQVLGDTMNIPLCGMLPMYLSAVCFDSLSAIMAIYLFHFPTVTACYIP